MRVARDPFARGEYERMTHYPGKCDWCGQHRKRLYSYRWVDDRVQQPSHSAGLPKQFCNLTCFRTYWQ
jgi:hypothetical protein